MKQNLPPEPDPSTNPDQLPACALPGRHNQWTPRKMANFLRELAATNNVSVAAKAVGMSRQSAYRLRARLKGSQFDIAWEAAFLHGYHNLAQAALERALHGVEVPHYHKGELIGTSRKYDERLTVALLTMRNRSGAPMMTRYGAAAEFHSEDWHAMLENISAGQFGWDTGDEEQDPEEKSQALIEKYAPDPGPGRMR